MKLENTTVCLVSYVHASMTAFSNFENKQKSVWSNVFDM